jgi:hypothetical protein
MNPGDLVRCPTGHGSDEVVGILLKIRDNPSDVDGTYAAIRREANGWKPRKIADVLSSGKIFTSWLAHIREVDESW